MASASRFLPSLGDGQLPGVQDEIVFPPQVAFGRGVFVTARTALTLTKTHKVDSQNSDNVETGKGIRLVILLALTDLNMKSIFNIHLFNRHRSYLSQGSKEGLEVGTGRCLPKPAVRQEPEHVLGSRGVKRTLRCMPRTVPNVAHCLPW